MQTLLNKTGLKPGTAARLAAAVLATLLVSACGTAPLSFLDGRLQPSSRIQLNTYSVRVISIDGDYSLQNPRVVGPGLHTLGINAAPGRGARNIGPKLFTFNVEPCTRYYLAAKRISPMDADWDLVVENKEFVGSCDPEKELAKSKAEKSAPMKPS